MEKITHASFRPLLTVTLVAFVLYAAACAGEGSGARPADTPPVGGTPAQTSTTSPASPPSTSAPASTAAPVPTSSPTPAADAATSPAAASLTTGPSASSDGGAAATLATTSAVNNPSVPPDLAALKLALAPVAQGISAPLYVTNAGDGSRRMFVVEKTGAIRIIAGGKLLDKPFLDISDRVTSSGSEQGLLGLAFPPDYASRKFFFVNYIDRNGNTMISRFNVTSDPNAADPASEFQVLAIQQPAPNHNGGDLVFGPDGNLWIGMGDGGREGDPFKNGQNTNGLLAKMLRIDVTSDSSKPYVIPPDNPAVAQKWPVRPEVWAIGLRNPWRYSFDQATGDLWIGDVGQDRIEEVDRVAASSKGGLNFGWSIMEGPSCYQAASCNQQGLVLPVASYEHGADGCSITGGYVYRGKQFPALGGVYLYGDYCSGRIWGLNVATPGKPQLLLESGPGLSSFAEDEAGEVYVTNLSDGTVRRVVLQ